VADIEKNKLIIIHYSEISLKKGNRGFFERSLKMNILEALDDIPGVDPRFDFGRFLLHMEKNVPIDIVVERLKKVIAIAHFCVAQQGSADLDELSEQVYKEFQHYEFESFRIDTRRADKKFPHNSVEINQYVGGKVFHGMNKKVDLSNPDVTCFIEIFNKRVYYYFEKVPSIRGLPVGSSGKVVSLLSAGIDSPVASYKIMTRGCKVIFVHFHSFPFTDKASYYNAITLAQHLTEYQYKSKLYLTPLAKIQQAIIPNVHPKFRLILYRRMMLRIAEIIALKEKAKALITGDSVGQVASQTLENIAAISQAVNIPILRPLIAMDKESIIDEARALGTFNTSIEPFDDCCSYLVPKNPETRAKLEQVLEAEQNIGDIKELVWEAINETEKKTLSFP
jgi:tRNA uracil 4-sulfurtransferase